MAKVKRLRSSRGAMASAFFQAIAALRYWPSRKNTPAAVTSSFEARTEFGSRSASLTRMASACLYSWRLTASSSCRRSSRLSSKSERSRGALDGAGFSCCAATAGAGEMNKRHNPSTAEGGVRALPRVTSWLDEAVTLLKGMPRLLPLRFWIWRPGQLCFPAPVSARVRSPREPHRTFSLRDKSARWPGEYPATSGPTARPFERPPEPGRIFPEPRSLAQEPVRDAPSGDRARKSAGRTSRTASLVPSRVDTSTRAPGEPTRRVSEVGGWPGPSFRRPRKLWPVAGGPAALQALA